MNIKKKLQHMENLCQLLEEITTNNPTAHLMLSGDLNITLDKEQNHLTAALNGILEKYSLIDIYRHI